MKSNQGQPGTRGPLVLLTMTALQADNFISCFVLTFNWKCHILVKVIKENDVHYQNVKSTSQLPSKMKIECLSPELLCNWHQNRCTECMSDEDCPDCGEVDPFFLKNLPVFALFLWHPKSCDVGAFLFEKKNFLSLLFLWHPKSAELIKEMTDFHRIVSWGDQCVCTGTTAATKIFVEQLSKENLQIWTMWKMKII